MLQAASKKKNGAGCPGLRGKPCSPTESRRRDGAQTIEKPRRSKKVLGVERDSDEYYLNWA